MDHMPLISVIVPVYNVQPYLEKALNSIIQQTLGDIQIILVDDGSDDGSLDICHEFARKDERIQMVESRHQGVAAARNIGLNIAAGEYIAFVDADDWLEHNMIEEMISVVTSDVGIVCCANDNREENGGYVSDSELRNEVLTKEQQIEYFFNNFGSGHLWNKLIRAELFSSIRFNDDYKDGEDADVYWKILLKNKYKIIHISNILYHYRCNKTSITKSRLSAANATQIDMWEKLEKECNVFAPKYSRNASTHLVVVCILFLYRMYNEKYYDDSLERRIISIIRRKIGETKNIKTLKYGLKKRFFAMIVCINRKAARRIVSSNFI